MASPGGVYAPSSFAPLALLSLAAFAVPSCLAAPPPATVANPSACPVEMSAAQRGLTGTLTPTGPNAQTPPGTRRAQQSIDLSMKNSACSAS